MVAAIFLGLSYAYRGGVFIRVTFLVDRLPAGAEAPDQLPGPSRDARVLPDGSRRDDPTGDPGLAATTRR